MTYFEELRVNWRPLLAALVGLGTGFSLSGTVASAIAPSLISDNEWSEAEFAAVGGVAIFTAAALPLVGRVADVLGVKRTALIGLVAMPLIYLAYSMMGGSLSAYVVIFILQSVVCVTTTSTVFTRLPVQYITHARGLALAIVASGPALTSAALGPVLNTYVEENGWRAAYQALAVFAAVSGLITYLLIPPERREPEAKPLPRRSARQDYPEILRSRAFWILAASMVLCNLPQVIMLTQLKLLLLDNGMSGADAGVAFTALALGMLTGRFLTGIALDRFDPYVVSFVTLALPSIGLYLLASSLDAAPILIFAVFCLGFAFGAEGDVVAYLVARSFGVRIYSSVLGLMTAVMSFSAASGAGLLSYTLSRTGDFALFLTIVGTAVIIGSSLLLLLRRGAREPDEAARRAEEAVPHPALPGTAEG
ncbi:MAG: MFS transporter [Novosphingobium sp.]